MPGQCLSVLAAYSFPSNQGPVYKKGIILNISFQCLGFVIAVFMTLFYRWENRRRDKKEDGSPAHGDYINVIEEHDLAVGKSLTHSNCEQALTSAFDLAGFRYVP
jgi:hypothetical protein